MNATQVGWQLGLYKACGLVKRAMQFGTRLANKKVAGYLAMSDAVDVVNIVNADFLSAERLAATGKGVDPTLDKRKNRHLKPKHYAF